MRPYFIFLILFIYSCSKSENNVELEIVSAKIVFSKLDNGKKKILLVIKLPIILPAIIILIHTAFQS